MTKMRRTTRYRILSVLLGCTVPVHVSIAQDGPAKQPFMVEQCDKSMSIVASRVGVQRPRTMAEHKAVVAECGRLLAEIEQEEAVTDEQWKQAQQAGRSRAFEAEREFALRERQWPLMLRHGVASAVAVANRSARTDFDKVIEFLEIGDVASDTVRRNDLGWALLARSTLDSNDFITDNAADLKRVVELAPDGLDDKIANASAYKVLGLDGSRKDIDKRLKAARSRVMEQRMTEAEGMFGRSSPASARNYYEAALTAADQHAKRGEIHLKIAVTHCQDYKACPAGDGKCRELRSKTLAEAEKAIREILAARNDPQETADYGGQLGQLVAEALMLRAQCRVLQEDLATALDVSASISEVEKASELNSSFGRARADQESLLKSLQDMLKRKSQ